MERVDSCFFANPNVVSSWVKDELGVVTSVKVSRSGKVHIFCICLPEEAVASRGSGLNLWCVLLSGVDTAKRGDQWGRFECRVGSSEKQYS